MTAPDPDRSSKAGDLPPEALATGQRALAAIVFTDTVGFSALMTRDEELTMRLVARDLAYMKTTCEAFGGQVLKSTGDGLLMLFTSAVQAVACALEIQRDIQKQNLELPPAEQLRHRIGIHLGDVFQHGGDAMGDGVNIAARLQTEAMPGGICLSKTVYDVVHNRLPFYVNELGARRLKNIGTVTAYQISPVVEGGQGWYRVEWYRWRPWVAQATKWVALVAIVAAVFWLGMRREWLLTHPGHQGAYTLLPLPKQANPTATPVPTPLPVAPVEPPTVANVPPEAVTVVTDQDFEMARFDRMRNYDFEGMMDWIAVHDWPGKNENHLTRECHEMQHLFRWTQEQLHAYSESSPLVVTNGDGTQTAFWTVSFGGLRMRTGAQTVTVMREQIAPSMMRRIVVELLKERPLSPEDRTHFQGDLAIFCEAYHLAPPNRKAGF